MKKLLTAIAIILLWAGFAWGAGVHYSGLTSTNNRCSFTSSYAWLDWSGKDFSAYAGGKWEVRLTDSSGYQAVGYVGSVGTGETLGSELVTNGDMELDAVWVSYVTPETNERSIEQVHGGTYSRKLVESTASSSGIRNINDTFTTQTGLLYTYSFWVYPSIDKITFTVRKGDDTAYLIGALIPGLNTNAWNNYTCYSMELGGGILAYVILWTNNVAGTWYFDDVSVKQVLTPSAAGVYILNGPTGSAGWASIHSSFSYNAIKDIQITPAASLSGVSVSGVGINN